MSVGTSRQIWSKRPTSLNLSFSCHPSPHLSPFLSLVLRIMYCLLSFLFRAMEEEEWDKSKTTPRHPYIRGPSLFLLLLLSFPCRNSLLCLCYACYPSIFIPCCFVTQLLCLFSSVACSPCISPCIFHPMRTGE